MKELEKVTEQIEKEADKVEVKSSAFLFAIGIKKC